MSFSFVRTLPALAAICALLGACQDGGLPLAWRATPEGNGPQILWDLGADPLPELPLPNDVATWPDPTSPTGRRINVSLVAPTAFERQTREQFDRLDGWGTYGAITIPFTEHVDVRDFFERQGGGSAAFSEEGFRRHAVYVVDMETGEAMPLDVNSGNFHYVLDRTDLYFEHDPRSTESNLLFETVEEDVNGNGVLDPGEDTDFDGHLDHPNTFDGTIQDELSTVDEMTWFYERETKTLILRPILPLRGRRTYAVVVTERLVGENGESVRSPFDGVHHYSQYEELNRLPELLSRHPDTYGSLAENGWDEIAFAWTFTTQSIYEDIDTLRAGLYGEGPFARLADEFPVDYVPATLQGGRACEVQGSAIVAPGDRFLEVVRTAGTAVLGLTEEQVEDVLTTYEDLDHVTLTFHDTPYYLGEGGETDLTESFSIDSQSGEGRIGRERVSMLTFVPKETPEHQQPFPVAFYVHGYSSTAAEPIPFAGYMLQHGIAASMLNAEGHGLPVGDGIGNLLEILFQSVCLSPTAPALVDGRAPDVNGDGTPDSGADFWTAYVFHTRDVLRQTVLDHMRAIQIIRSFDGRRATPMALGMIGDDPLEYDADLFEYDGRDIAGDFDGNGRPDFGGPDVDISMTGGSLGGIVTGITGGAEPALRSVAPIVGAGGLTDVAARIDMGLVRAAMHLRMMGPFVMSRPAASFGENTSCAEGEHSLYFLSALGNTRAETEFACVPDDALAPDSVMMVRNLENNEVACAGATNGVGGAFRIPFPADEDDPLQIEIYRGASLEVEFEHCRLQTPRAPDILIDQFGVDPSACERCGSYALEEFAAESPLISPHSGFGMKRQTPSLRRLLMLAQVGLDPADPVNFARRVFLEPVGSTDIPAAPKNLLVLNATGDQSVPVSAGNAYARAAGLLPFAPPGAPPWLREWTAPEWFGELYDGVATPNDLLIQQHVLEGVDRLGRHPIEGAENFLFDIDNIAEGRQRFSANGRAQSIEPDALTPPSLDRPLRWVRASGPMNPRVDPWRPVVGGDISGLLNYYAIPNGVHGFDKVFYTEDVDPWDTSQYIINLVARWGATSGQDLRYYSDPLGHQCLEDSSCDFLQEE